MAISGPAITATSPVLGSGPGNIALNLPQREKFLLQVNLDDARLDYMTLSFERLRYVRHPAYDPSPLRLSITPRFKHEFEINVSCRLWETFYSFCKEVFLRRDRVCVSSQYSDFKRLSRMCFTFLRALMLLLQQVRVLPQ